MERIFCKNMSHPIVHIHGTLQLNQVETLTDDVARSLIRQFVFSLEFRHLQRIAQRDVKPANVLVTTGDVVWPLLSSDRPHYFVVNSVYHDKGQVALPRPSTAFIAPIYVNLHPPDDIATN